MGFIYILLGIISIHTVNKSEKKPADPDFNIEDMQKYSWLIMNPILRLILKITGIILIISGIVSLFL